MIADCNIVCIASNWFDHPTSKQHVMRLLAERNDVVWVNYHASRRPSLSKADSLAIVRRLRQVFGGAKQVEPHVRVVSPLVVPWPESRVARAFNGFALARQIRRALAGLPQRPTQLWLFAPDAPEVISALRPEHTVYYCVDDFAAFTGYNADLVERLERRTIAAADTVIATSQPLCEHVARLGGDAHFVPHGVDFDHFAQAPTLPDDAIPDDVRRLSGPIFGYFGQISDYVDLELLADVARRRPVWQFVILGNTQIDLAPYQGVANLHLLGPRPYESLPAYCRAFDVGLIPFRMSRLIKAVNPIKLREYLAAGLPVISSPMPEVLHYRPCVFTAETADEFIAAGEQALTATRQDVETRQNLVRSESWRSRVAHLADLISRDRTAIRHSRESGKPVPPLPGFPLARE